MLRTLALAVLSISCFAAFADVYTAYDNEQSRQARIKGYPYSVNSVSHRVAFIEALTRLASVSHKTVVGYLPADCGVEHPVKFVSATLQNGQVCTSPAPTSCESRTVSCE